MGSTVAGGPQGETASYRRDPRAADPASQSQTGIGSSQLGNPPVGLGGSPAGECGAAWLG